MEAIGDEVLAAARAGDEPALSALWRARQAPLLRYLAAQRYDPAPVVAQQVWVAVAGEIARFDGVGAGFDRWLFSIAHRVGVETLPPPESGGPAEPNGDAGLDALRHLDRRTAGIVALRLLADLPADDVAAITGRPAVEVETLLTAGLTELVERAARLEGVSA